MLYLVAQKDQQICEFTWKTIKAERHTESGLDAKATFNCGGTATRVGIVNNLQSTEATAKLTKLANSLSAENIESVLLISRDDQDKLAMQKTVLEFGGELATKTVFATHQELYRDGIVGVGWVTANGQKAELFKQGEVTFMPGVAAAQSIAV